MTTFLTDLWSSILTPGTNSALITATHCSFAGLQLTLLGLLVATRSYHFVFLSVLSGGLWGAITWFVAAVEEEARRIEGDVGRVRKLREGKGEVEGEGTEAEGEKEGTEEKKDI
ncbi:ER protein Pkr1-domain-containing protein [Geopyxis carbonaria]|nr:ER protein Pkr1-domain-containing protein [Geopyxis carbonaria]